MLLLHSFVSTLFLKRPSWAETCGISIKKKQITIYKYLCRYFVLILCVQLVTCTEHVQHVELFLLFASACLVLQYSPMEQAIGQQTYWLLKREFSFVFEKSRVQISA